MKLVQILLPVRDNRGRKFKRAVYPAGPLWLDACPEYEIIFGRRAIPGEMINSHFARCSVVEGVAASDQRARKRWRSESCGSGRQPD
jgi:hypothetical protein